MTAANDTGETTFATPTDRAIVITRTVAAPRQLVFDAWTKPEHVQSWMLGPPGWSMPVCEIDLRPGGTWRFVWRDKSGGEMEMEGVYQEITEPSRIVHTESWGEDWARTLNTLELTEEEGRTTMIVTVLYPTKQARDAALATGMKEGMELSFARLAGHLA